MKNLKYLILTISSLFLLTSCDRELDINPEQRVVLKQQFQLQKEFSKILIGAYANTGDGDLFGGDLQIYADLLADDSYLYWWELMQN